MERVSRKVVIIVCLFDFMDKYLYTFIQKFGTFLSSKYLLKSMSFFATWICYSGYWPFTLVPCSITSPFLSCINSSLWKEAFITFSKADIEMNSSLFLSREFDNNIKCCGKTLITKCVGWSYSFRLRLRSNLIIALIDRFRSQGYFIVRSLLISRITYLIF